MKDTKNVKELNWEQTLIYQRERIRELQDELDLEREGVEQLREVLNGILWSLLEAFGEENEEGGKSLKLPRFALRGERVELQRGENGGWVMKTDEAHNGKQNV